MSLSPPMPSAGRPLEEQAIALVAFLAARDNILTRPQASSALDGLPADPKPAAKELRGRLKALGVDIQHMHALKAVAEARGAESYLGLGEQLSFEVASWSPDSPGVSCEKVRLTSFAAAADEVSRRVREQYENDAPYVMLHPYSRYLLVTATSALTGSWWKLLLAPVGRQETEARFPNVGMLERLAERLRRLVEGQLGGWVDGTYDVGDALDGTDGDIRGMALRHEAEFADQLQVFHRETSANELPRQVPDESHWLAWKPLTQQQWDDFLKRYAFFSRRNDVPLFRWAQELGWATSKPRFEPVAIKGEVLERARLASNATWNDIWIGFPYDQDGQAIKDLRAGRASLDAVQHVALALGIDPNGLLAPQRSTPRIPLTHHTDIGMWLSRLDAVVSQPDGAPQAAVQFVNRLRALCAVPYEKRRSWEAHPPADLEALNQEIRFAGLMVCAGMGTRFVTDLPLGWTRPASISVLEFDWQTDVLTQGGQLDPDNRSMDIGPERDPVTPEWLARFNKPRFTASDLLRYSDAVHEHIRPEDDEKGRFTSKVFAGVKVFNRDPERAHAASVRMEALSRLIKDRPMEPWVRKSRDTNEETSLMISEAAFEATARCELVDIGGEPGYDRQSFYMLCVKHARKYS